MIHDKTFYFMI